MIKIKDILSLPTCEFFGIFNTGKLSLTYMQQNGIRKHTLSMEHNMYDRITSKNFKTFEFVDIYGNVTDEFYGNWNDFDIWFLTKAAKGEQFFIICYPNNPEQEKVMRAVRTQACLGSSIETFEQKEDMTWELIPKEIIQNERESKQHTLWIVDGETGDVLEEFHYTYIYWHPFEEIFEKYQKQHLKFDVIGDDGKSTKLFRKYQQTPNGTWVKKPY